MFDKLIKRMKIKNKGFTLLELLVVVGIMSVIMALLVASYVSAQKRGRDAKRKSDLKAMQNALEQYYGENSYEYPTPCSGAASYLQSGVWPTLDPKGEEYDDDCLAASYTISIDLETDESTYTVTNLQ